MPGTKTLETWSVCSLGLLPEADVLPLFGHPGLGVVASGELIVVLGDFEPETAADLVVGTVRFWQSLLSPRTEHEKKNMTVLSFQ